MFLFDLILTALTVLAASRWLPGVTLASPRAALKVSVVYALLSVLGALALYFVPFYALLPRLIARPLSFVIVGIPAFYATELFVSGFEVADIKTAAKLAALVAFVQLCVAALLA